LEPPVEHPELVMQLADAEPIWQNSTPSTAAWKMVAFRAVFAEDVGRIMTDRGGKLGWYRLACRF